MRLERDRSALTATGPEPVMRITIAAERSQIKTRIQTLQKILNTET